MTLTAQDRKALEMACNCIRNCQKYGIQPAPYFPLTVRMYRELEEAGMIKWDEDAGLDGSPSY